MVKNWKKIVANIKCFC